MFIIQYTTHIENICQLEYCLRQQTWRNQPTHSLTIETKTVTLSYTSSQSRHGHFKVIAMHILSLYIVDYIQVMCGIVMFKNLM